MSKEELKLLSILSEVLSVILVLYIASDTASSVNRTIVMIITILYLPRFIKRARQLKEITRITSE